MNPLLAELHRRYAREGVPSLSRQADDLVALAHRRHAERTEAAIRALEGYRSARLAERRQVRSIWDRKAGLRISDRGSRQTTERAE